MPDAGSQREALRDELRNLFAQAKLPTNPASAARILDLINDPRSGAVDFAHVIETDPALAARLLAMANTSYFAQSSQVTTIQRSVTVLGLRRVKTAALGFQLVKHLDRLGNVPFDMKVFWQFSLVRACLAQTMAGSLLQDCREEAFLVGLLQECGVLPLVQVLGNAYTNEYGARNLSPSAFFHVERATFPYTHVDAIRALAAEWRLPELIASPLERHHDRVTLTPASDEIDRLSAIAYYVGALHFRADADIVESERDLKRYRTQQLGVSDRDWEKIISQAGEAYRGTAALFQDHLPGDVDVTDMLAEANAQLVRVVEESDRRLLDARAEHRKIRHEQRRLENSLKEYRERSALDPLTGVLNRGGLVEAATVAIEKQCDTGTAIGVLFADLDDFKPINDTYGHQCGDNLLKAFALALRDVAGHEAVVGRYGGEEFVVILCGASASETRALGEAVCERSRQLDLRGTGFEGSLTCSVGAITVERSGASCVDELFSCADALMYEAKRAGKNRSCFHVIAESDSPQLQARRATRTAAEGGLAAVDLVQIAERMSDDPLHTATNLRKQQRRDIAQACTLRCFSGAGAALVCVDAATRNISTGGIGLLVRRPLVRGEAVEVDLCNDERTLFLAGLVTFSRHVRGDVYDVGVQLVAHSNRSVLEAEFSERPDWIAQALGTLRSRHADEAGEREPIGATPTPCEPSQPREGPPRRAPRPA